MGITLFLTGAVRAILAVAFPTNTPLSGLSAEGGEPGVLGEIMSPPVIELNRASAVGSRWGCSPGSS